VTTHGAAGGHGPGVVWVSATDLSHRTSSRRARQRPVGPGARNHLRASPPPGARWPSPVRAGWTDAHRLGRPAHVVVGAVCRRNDTPRIDHRTTNVSGEGRVGGVAEISDPSGL